VLAAARACGKGRAVYLAGLPYTLDNNGLLLRILLWLGRRESGLRTWNCVNPKTECAWFPAVGRLIVINNDAAPQTTTVFDGDGRPFEVYLQPYQMRWFTP
jgi:1,3-beta-galactosyl-N-acetylhexosamine phosphorylase